MMEGFGGAAMSPHVRRWGVNHAHAVLYAPFGGTLDHVFTSFPILAGGAIVYLVAESLLVASGAVVGGLSAFVIGLAFMRRTATVREVPDRSTLPPNQQGIN